MSTFRKRQKNKGLVSREIRDGHRSRPFGLRIVPFLDHGRSSHVLLLKGNQAAHVNGQRVIGGLCVLNHQDDITVDRHRFFYSAESKPEITVYRQAEHVRLGTLEIPVTR